MRPTSPLETIVRTALPVDVRLTLRALRHGGGDPATRGEGGAFWRATRTPAGPATARYAPVAGGGAVQALGPGAARCLESAARPGSVPSRRAARPGSVSCWRAAGRSGTRT